MIHVVPGAPYDIKIKEGDEELNPAYAPDQCLSPLTLVVRIMLRRGALDTALCDKVYQ
jgi:hypothetical protein